MEKLESSLVGMQNDAVWCKLKSKAFDAKLRKQTELPYDSTTPLLGICPKDLNIELGQIFAAMFTAVLFTRANRCKQPMYISRETEKQIVACTSKKYSPLKGNEVCCLRMNFKNRACVCVCVCVRARARMCVRAQSCPILCNPKDCSPPGSSVHGIFQERILEWVAIPCSKGSSWPRYQTHVPYVSHTDRWVLYH